MIGKSLEKEPNLSQNFSFAEAENLGIEKSRVANFHADSVGVRTNFMAVSACMTSVRKNDELEECCLEMVNDDYKSR